MRTIKLMADYQCYPLWEASPGKVGNIDPASLPISNTLKSELMNWAHLYTATLNLDDPAASGFKNDADENEFKRIANELKCMLQAELGEGYSVILKI